MNELYDIRPVPNEIGRYFCKSKSLFCSDPNPSGCRFAYQHKGDNGPKHVAGDKCPTCGNHSLEFNDYLVELGLYGGMGKCACDRWRHYLQPQIRKLTPEQILIQRRLPDLICQHVAAVRIYFALEYIDRMAKVPFEKWGLNENEGE